jgi:folate-dependent phosphoribosylglycinamide formyltransferase PurN
MKIYAVFGEGSSQRALAHRLHHSFSLAHIARVRLEPKGKRKMIRSLTSLTLARGLRAAWMGMLHRYDVRYPDWPSVPSSIHSTANDEELVGLIESEKPDLVLVSGTDLLTKRTLDRFGTKVMNLHTGISPYIRGAPNCTNWALALGEFDLIGNTVMWIDTGIDSGAIVTTERTPLTGRETLGELHVKVMEHAHDLYCRTVEAFVTGRPLPSVAQGNITKGRLFRTRNWNSAAMVRAVFNHKYRYRPFANRPEIRLIPLDLTRRASREANHA